VPVDADVETVEQRLSSATVPALGEESGVRVAELVAGNGAGRILHADGIPVRPRVAIGVPLRQDERMVFSASSSGRSITMAKLPPNAVHPRSRAAWKDWLLENHARVQGVWLVSFKKHTGRPRMAYEECVEEALCFGWIDSKPKKLDEERSMLWFSPRRPGTGWSRPNKERIERLLRAGLMHPSGRAKIDQAKADGSWTLLDAVEELAVPADLGAALAAYPRAEQHFLAFPRSVKRGILEWIHSAKRPQTRAARIAETARLASANERANQWRGKDVA
jgi:uncharacterized protein YdeI (YjbR/CyaY-like superfamily)